LRREGARRAGEKYVKPETGAWTTAGKIAARGEGLHRGEMGKLEVHTQARRELQKGKPPARGGGL